MAYAPIGRLEVIAGPMFAGKTEELIRRVRRAAIAGRRVQVFSHGIDQRSRPGMLGSHAGIEFPSQPVSSAVELRDAVAADTEVVAIDEAQFFGPDLVPLTADMAGRGIDVLVAGLDVTFEGEPFAPLPALMALAERVDKLTAICTVCGAEAVFHQRVTPRTAGAERVTDEHIGGLGKYEARCRRHFEPSEGVPA